MLVVLDSNIFIFALKDNKEGYADILKLSGVKFTCVIPKRIVKEIFERLKMLEGKDFASFVVYSLNNLQIEVITDEVIPTQIIAKYKGKGAKEGDAIIAAFVEWIKADYLVTENRDFLKEIKTDFKTIKAGDFIKLLKEKKL